MSERKTDKTETLADALAALDKVEAVLTRDGECTDLHALAVVRRVLRRQGMLLARVANLVESMPQYLWTDTVRRAVATEVRKASEPLPETDDPPALPDNPVPGPTVYPPYNVD